MAVWKRFYKDGTFKYVVSWYPNGSKGKEARKTMPAHYTEEMALEYERIMLEGRNHRKDSTPVGRTFSDFVKSYYAWLKLHRSPNTARDVANCFKNHVMQHFGNVELADLGPQHFTAYKQMRHSEKGSNVSINKEMAYFRGFCKYLSREAGAMQPLAFMTEKLPYKRPKPKVLSDDEATAILMAAEPMYQAFFLLLYGAGLRKNEARMLRVEDVDLNVKIAGSRKPGGQIRVTRKGGELNILPLDGWPLEALRATIGDRTEGWVFRSPKRHDRPIYDARDALERAKLEAKIPKSRRIHNHLFRHSIATRMIKEKVPMRIIQDFLGHSQISMTEWYTQVMPEVLRENILTISIPKKRKKQLINKDLVNG